MGNNLMLRKSLSYTILNVILILHNYAMGSENNLISQTPKVNRNTEKSWNPRNRNKTDCEFILGTNCNCKNGK